MCRSLTLQNVFVALRSLVREGVEEPAANTQVYLLGDKCTEEKIAAEEQTKECRNRQKEEEKELIENNLLPK